MIYNIKIKIDECLQELIESKSLIKSLEEISNNLMVCFIIKLVKYFFN